MKKTKIKIKLTREDKLKLLKRVSRQSVGLPPVGKKVPAKKGGSYKRKSRHEITTDEWISN